MCTLHGLSIQMETQRSTIKCSLSWKEEHRKSKDARYVILQLILHYILTMISIVYLTTFVPQQDLIEYRLELMNECLTVIVIDLCFLFTDLDSDRSRQYNSGFVLIVTILICVGAHVVFLFTKTIKDIILKFRKPEK